jgi:hypothetical protein
MNRQRLIACVITLLCLTGCWEYFSWSPGGRYLAFAGSDDRPWQWDTRTGLASQMSASEGKVAQVMYLASADKYLLRYCEDDEGYEDCTVSFPVKDTVLK